MSGSESVFLWRRFTLREALLLGFCATFIVLTRGGLRLHLHLPGHVMFFSMFFLVMARGAVPKMGSATLVGLVAGLVGMLLGMGKGSPLGVLKFVIPGLIVDAGAFIIPSFAASIPACVAIGMLAAASRVIIVTGMEWLTGMEEEILIQKMLIGSLMNAVFGGIGAALVPPVVSRLRVNGLISRK